MKPYELDRFLRSEGFSFLRFGSKHKIYNYQGFNLIVPQGKAVRPSTMSIIRKQIKLIQAKVLTQGNVEEEDFSIPDDACEPILIKGENTTELSEHNFTLYSDIVEFCQSRAGCEDPYTLSEVLRFVDRQLYHFNNLVEEAVGKHDLNVLFDLKEALAIVQVSSHQISDAIEDFETLTAPTPPGYTVPPKGSPAAARPPTERVLPFITDRKRAPMPAPIAPVGTSISGEMASISAPPVLETKTAPADVSHPPQQEAKAPAPKGLSVRQAAVAKIMAVFGELGPEDTGPVLRQVTAFVEMG